MPVSLNETATMQPSRLNNLLFRLMALHFRLRDRIRPPLNVLREVGLRPGMAVLDFGCGPGEFSLAAGRLVGPDGRVYALDICPLALESVRRAALKQGLGNIRTVPADALAELPEGVIDVVLLYDVLHDIREPASTLSGIYRILKSGGTLSVSDHHLRPQVLSDTVSAGGYFRPVRCGRWTFRFERTPAGGEAP